MHTYSVAEIFECEDDNNGTNVLHLKNIHVSMYTAIHQALQFKTYTIVAAGYREFRGHLRWHFITKCGLKIRAGKSLDKIWRVWRGSHVVSPDKIGSVAGVPFMDFRVLKMVRSHGTYDMQCEAC